MNIKTLETHLRLQGKKFKYPQCCIDQFVKRVLDRVLQNKRVPMKEKNVQASCYRGYMPCDTCTDEIFDSFDPNLTKEWSDHTKDWFFKKTGRIISVSSCDVV